MKTSTMNLMLATAVMMVASTVSFAQNLRAEIPFSFRVGDKVMAPGSYEVHATNGEAMLYLHSEEGNSSALLAAGVKGDAPKAWIKAGRPSLGFECGEGPCVLQSIWTATGAPAHFYAKSGHKDERSRLAVIQLAVPKAR
jgi:hypothetical protein